MPFQFQHFATSRTLACVVFFAAFVMQIQAEDGILDSGSVLVEAESLEFSGGWSLDTQFIREMGSAYLLAHGLGQPVSDATGSVTVPAAGEYRVFVRTKDWVARWKADGQPGRFQVLIDGKPLAATFGTVGADWHWQDGGTVVLEKPSCEIRLHDLTGFDGRCDAIFLTQGNAAPPNDDSILATWRRKMLGLDSEAKSVEPYDLVVIGGGYSGLGASISAARAGCRVALIQDRSVLGGNGSSEVRVWAQGNVRRGKYRRIGEIIEEVADRASKSPGAYEEFEDAKKEAIVRAEPNIDLFLNHHAYKVDVDDNRIKSIEAFDTRTSQCTKFVAPLFVDCTGHATIGFLAGAELNMEPDGRMGMSNMWAWDEAETPTAFPETPWALDLGMEDFPYPRNHHGEWFWESGFDKDALNDAEGIRDWNLRAVYGAFNAMKNRDGAADHATAFLTWVAFVGGPRESRRLVGDVVLTQEDIVSKREFSDGTVPSTWSIDLHYPKKQYAQKYPDNPFISIAQFGAGVDRMHGYPIPYRCFYSRNIDNLFMAGRCISVTHEALGTVRVMKTCGMMGEVVGKAASICRAHECLPRDVYYNYWSELDSMLRIPGAARRANFRDEYTIPVESTSYHVNNKPLPGIVLDDRDAVLEGEWSPGDSLKGYVGEGYIYASDTAPACATFELAVKEPGRYEVRVSYQAHENRGTRVPITIMTPNETRTVRMSMKSPPELELGFASLGEIQVAAGETVTVTIRSGDSGGITHVDAVQLVPAH